MITYRSSVDATEQMSTASPEEAEKGIATWLTWAQKAGPALIDLGSPVGKSQTIPAGANTGLSVGGFSVLEADSVDEVIKLLKDTRSYPPRA
jgi:hypothetical protein